MEDWSPDPLEHGSLEPPRRRPPTAVGVATPPPPRRPSRFHETRTRHIRRTVGQILLSATLGLAAGAFIQTPVLLALLFGLIGMRSQWRRRAQLLNRAAV